MWYHVRLRLLRILLSSLIPRNIFYLSWKRSPYNHYQRWHGSQLKDQLTFILSQCHFNFKIFSSSPCPSMIKMSFIWSCKNTSNKTMMLVSAEGEKIITLHYKLPLSALHGVLFWCPLLCETFLIQLCLKFWQMSTKNIYLLLKIQLCHCLTDLNFYLLFWYTLLVAQSAWLYFHCFLKFWSWIL